MGIERLPGSAGCFVCDSQNRNGRSLRLPLHWNPASGEVFMSFTPDDTWCGYEGVVHGGLVAAVLDEAMAWAVRQATGDWAFTADFRLRYRQAVCPGLEYRVTARVSEDRGRKITATAEFFCPDGSLAARAQADFLPGRGRARQRTDQDDAGTGAAVQTS